MEQIEFRVDDVTIATLLDRQSMKWRRYPPDVIPMWVADMDFGVAPCVQAVMEKLTAKGDYGYALRDGEVPAVAVSKAFSCRMNEKFAWRVDPDDTLVVGDLVQALFATTIAFTDPGKSIILQTPIYPPDRKSTRLNSSHIQKSRMPSSA